MADLRESIASIKAALSLEEYVESAGVSLKRSGSRSKGLCPFHHEKTPSFSVDSTTQTYHCFGCGEHGDIITFAQEQFSYGFLEAVTVLAEEAGVPLPELDGERSNTDYGTLKAIVREAARFYWRAFRQLPEEHPAVANIIERGLPPHQKGGIQYGYASSANVLLKHLEREGYSREAMHEAGVLGHNEETDSYYDFFRTRLLFFISDVRGNPVAFSGRGLGDYSGGKYINTPDTPLFNKSRVLYHLSDAAESIRAKSEVYVVEGQFDVSALVAAGVQNVVATSGTALTVEHVATLSRMVGENGRIILCFDGDKAGVAAAYKVFSTIPDTHTMTDVVLVPDGMDPCDYRQANGDEALRDLLGQRTGIVDAMLENVFGRHDVDTVPGRHAIADDAVAKVLVHIIDPLTLNAATRRVALESVTDIRVLKEAVREAKKTGSTQRTPRSSAPREEADAPAFDPSQADAHLSECIHTQRTAYIFAKLVSLWMKTGGLSDSVWRFLTKAGRAEFAPVLDVLSQRPEKVYPELFTTPESVRMMLTDTFMPVLVSMDEDAVARHAEYLMKAYQDEQRREREQDLRARSFRALAGGTTSDLERALS